MNSSTRQSRQIRRLAAAAAGIAVLVAGAACGTEQASDRGSESDAPSVVAPKAEVAPHAPTSADGAERRAAAAQQKARKQAELQSQYAPGHHRELLVP